MNHTPGPWEVRYVTPLWCVISRQEYMPTVAYVDHGTNPLTAEDYANARLLAAAPELLDALTDLVASFWDGRPKQDVKRDYRLMVLVEAAKTAIAKATE